MAELQWFQFIDRHRNRIINVSEMDLTISSEKKLEMHISQ